ncbi:MAG: phosphate acyltransferase, partial [Parvibaculales bacterium]
MTETVIAIDAMGGDFGPAVTIDGLARTHKARPHVSYLLFGNEDQISAELQ